jgi:hypothetical protein
MMSVTGLNARSLDIKRGIRRIRILPMRLTPWSRTTSSAPRSPNSDYITKQSI